MKNRWKGLVIGGLTGAAFGVVIDIFAKAGEGALEGAELIQEHGAEALHWAKGLADKASEKIRDVEVPDKVHDIAHTIQTKAPDIVQGVAHKVKDAGVADKVQDLAQKAKDAGLADKVQSAAGSVAKRMKDAGVADKAQDLAKKVVDSDAADLAREAAMAANEKVKEAAGKK
ncbi:MAG: hypothetical protein ACRDJU_12055 [Actinomycetota bacterium]